ncbi:MAG: hypothetical protein H6739_38410 [Alphaproteobacteria bacterium]|nr:hypothetical protein [Alphaproteobacteria bacterium]
MSERNTALLIAGHVPPRELIATLLAAPGVNAADFAGEEAPRVGHGARAGVDYTHLALRLFELGGLLLMDRSELPGPDELEVYLGLSLSGAHGAALFLYYDDEQGVGGHALFQDGVLVSRAVVDGRWDEPVRRTLEGESVIPDVDPSHWVWPLIADAVEAGARPLFGPGVRTDDDIEALIKAAKAGPIEAAGPRPPTAEADPAEAEPPRKRDRVRRAVKRLLGRA